MPGKAHYFCLDTKTMKKIKRLKRRLLRNGYSRHFMLFSNYNKFSFERNSVPTYPISS